VTDTDRAVLWKPLNGVEKPTKSKLDLPIENYNVGALAAALLLFSKKIFLLLCFWYNISRITVPLL
jgi:hypothetical protein